MFIYILFSFLMKRHFYHNLVKMGALVLFLYSLLFVATANYIEALGAGTIFADRSHFHLSEPHVAFMCGKPSMHSTPAGWQPDYSQDCIEDPEEILKYCQRQYPEEKIANIEPAQTEVDLPNWCSFQDKNCANRQHTTHRVRPYRCLVGPVSAEPLIVPAHCRFGHVTYQQSVHCELFQFWNTTAQSKCALKSQQLQSFGVLFPCVKDSHHRAMHFSGVEFVCCPRSLAKSSDKSASGFVVRPAKPLLAQDRPSASPSPPAAYTGYLEELTDPSGRKSEHDRFIDARQAARDWIRSKEADLEGELAKTEKSLDHMWQVDPTVAAKLEKNNQERFSRLFKAFLEEDLALQRQLDSVHQQRVGQQLQQRRDQALQVLDYVLQEAHPEEGRVVQALERAIRAVVKSKVHTINHFEHLRISDPEEALRLKSGVKKTLEMLDKQMTAALHKLDTIPSMKAGIMKQVEEFMSQFNEVDRSAKESMSAKIGPAEDTSSIYKAILTKYEHVNIEGGLNEGPVHVAPLRDETPRGEISYDLDINQGDRENHHGDNRAVQQAALNHAKSMSHEGRVSAMLGGTQASLVIGLCAAGVVCLVLVGVGAAFIHHRSTFNRSHAGYTMSVVEIEPTAAAEAANKQKEMEKGAESPEERHLAAMQMNGYENPTYKYFEKPGGAPANQQS